MKTKIVSWAVMLFSINCLSSQNSFIINDESGPNIERISDIKPFDNKYFCLYYHLHPEELKESFSSLDVYSIIGNKLSSNKLGPLGFTAFQILSINNTSLQILGSIRTDSCSSAIVIWDYLFLLDTMVELAKYEFCNQQFIQKAIQTSGINDKKFIEGYYSEPGPAFHKFILEQSTTGNLLKIFDSLPVVTHLSIDFKGTGYILRDNQICDFFTGDFIFRKQRYNFMDGFELSAHSTHLPYKNHLLLEHVNKSGGEGPIGQSIRVVDSTLSLQKIVTISPDAELLSFMDLPFFEGLKKAEDDYYWMAGTYRFYPEWDSNYYSITKLDPELNIVCNHFLGYDAIYRLFGTTPTPDGGVIVYGWRLAKGGIINRGDEDAFAIKLGPNCELPTVSTAGSESPLISVSVYPNPGINEVSFDIQGFDPTTLRMELINVQGQVLFSADDLSNRIEVADLPAGQYFYRILQKDRLLGVGGWVKE